MNNAPLRLVLLPGMDGTGLLFEEFLAELPDDIVPTVIALPNDQPRGYDELEAWLAQRLPEGRLALLGESFSGPLAIRIATRFPDRVVAVVLVASFTEVPVPGWLAALARIFASAFFRLPLPRFGVRLALAGPDAPRALVDRVVAAVRSVAPAVIARRVIEVVNMPPLSPPRVVLSLAGRRDRLVGRGARRALAVDDVVVDAPHLVLQRRPRECAALVADFLRGLA